MSSEKMTPIEMRAVFSLSSIMALRMIGLFMVLPVFTLYASQLPGATPTLVGLAIGIYGLSQALCQIPFGSLSDHFGRKPIILMGLIIFIMGSILAGAAHSISLMIIGRALQGVGAVGSTILALVADLTREEQRTKAMAISGITIGFSFSLAMLIGPLLSKWMAINNLFFLAAMCGLLGIFILFTRVPTPVMLRFHKGNEPVLAGWLKLLTTPELAKLNLGIFVLHAIFTASFVVIPISLHQFVNLPATHQWILYVPTLLTAFVLSIVCIGLAEKRQQVKPYFISGIVTIAISELFLWFEPTNLFITGFALVLFFSGFSLLEAFMPSLISRTAPIARKGSALGIYSCAQFLGIFVGGFLGGWLYGKYRFQGVYLFCLILSLCWLIIAFYMRPQRHSVTQVLRISPSQIHQWEIIAAKLRIIPGMIEVSLMAEDNLVYVKIERSLAKNPDFIRLKEQLQSESFK